MQSSASGRRETEALVRDNGTSQSQTSMDLLVEFAMAGPPLSLQTKNRRALRAYKNDIRAAALLALRAGRAAGPDEDVFFSIGDISWRGNQADADNIIKPAQDALSGLVYVDDKQVRDSLGFNRKQLGLNIVATGTLQTLAAALVSGREFLHIAVSAAADPHFKGLLDV